MQDAVPGFSFATEIHSGALAPKQDCFMIESTRQVRELVNSVGYYLHICFFFLNLTHLCTEWLVIFLNCLVNTCIGILQGSDQMSLPPWFHQLKAMFPS